MPRTKEANRRIHEEQRSKILAGARTVFARKGMAATMAEVAAAAGVSQGLAYRYFISKEAIFRSLVEQTVQASVRNLQRILEMRGTPGERLEFLIARLLEGRREHPEFYQLLYQETSGETPPDDLRELVARQRQVFIDAARQLVVAGQATGEVAAGDADQLVTAMVAYLDGLTRMALYDAERLKQHFPDAEIILRIFRPRADRS